MDQETLVKDQVEDGKKIINQLIHDGFDVSAAAWIRRNEPAKWYLYVVSKIVDQGGQLAAYQALNESIQELPDLWIDPFRIRLIATTDPIAVDLLKHLQEYPKGRRYWGPRLGNASIDEAYIYPANHVAVRP